MTDRINLTSISEINHHSFDEISQVGSLTLGSKVYKVIPHNGELTVSRDLTDVSYRCLNAIKDFFSRLLTPGESVFETRSQQLTRMINSNHFLGKPMEIKSSHFFDKQIAIKVEKQLNQHKGEYNTLMGDRIGKAQGELNAQLTSKKISEAISQTYIFGGKSKAASLDFATQRDAVNIAMNRVKYSAKEQLPAKAPSSEISILMPSEIKTQSGKVVCSNILSVVAPPLDIVTQPDYKQYVDSKGRLKTAPFQQRLDCIKKDIMQAAQISQCKRVVLSGYGTAAFMGALKHTQHNDYNTALNMIYASLGEIRSELEEKGLTVVHMGNDPFWPTIKDKAGKGIKCVDEANPFIPGDWIQGSDLLINAWDPHSIIGNGCAKDQSLDGYIGRNSTQHFIHSMMCKSPDLIKHENVIDRDAA